MCSIGLTPRDCAKPSRRAMIWRHEWHSPHPLISAIALLESGLGWALPVSCVQHHHERLKTMTRLSRTFGAGPLH